MRRAPQALRDLFDKFNTPPPWLDYKAFDPAIRAFNANVDLMLIAFVTGVLVEGFSTLIAKSFRITGRVGATTSRLPILIIRVYNGGLEGVLGSGGFDAEEIHGGVSSG